MKSIKDHTPRKPKTRRLGKNADRLFKRQESRLAAVIGGRKQPGSGSGPFHKGDVKGVHDWQLLIEAKSTGKKSLSIKLEWLEKITREATAAHRIPALAVTFQNTPFGVPDDWVLVPIGSLLHEKIK